MGTEANRTLRPARAALLAVLLSAGVAGSAAAQTSVCAPPPQPSEQFNCLPTCAGNDSRLLAIAAGGGFQTLSDPALDLTLIAPAGTSSFKVGIFDGDAIGGTMGPPPEVHWDVGNLATAPLFEYTLFADPEGSVSGTQAVVGPVVGSTVLNPANQLPDNDWCDFVITTGPEAQAANGDYVYRLRVELMNPATAVILNGFKVRTSAIAAIEPIAQPFGYIAQLTQFDNTIVYPSFPLLTPTTYDGTFSFFVEAEAAQTAVEVWGGDFDYGKIGGNRFCTPQPSCLIAQEQDTDDPNTPGAPFEPPWATFDANPEGVAAGSSSTTGAPNDDVSTNLANRLLRQPSIRYDMISPDFQVFPNDNPSGNREWELFKVSAVAGDPVVPECDSPSDASADCTTGGLPAGAYELRIQGLDMANLNFLLTGLRVLCAEEDGDPCPLPSDRPIYTVGDTVFEDVDGNGVQDSGEPGIQGVVVNLVGAGGGVIDTTVTDENGEYAFTVYPDVYTVEVAPESFAAPGAGAALGDTVWHDADGDGIPDAGEPGIANVVLHLYLDDGDGIADPASDTFVALTRTDLDGHYLFQGLAAGSYWVDVIDFTVPAGLALVTAGGASDPSAVVTLAAGELNPDVDFPYANADPGTALVGDFVWNDADGDGLQDAGEAGIGDVTLELLLEITGPCPLGQTCRTIDGTLYQVVDEARTESDGSYLFAGVAAGNYRVRVSDTAGLLAGYTLTGGASPTAGFTVSAGDVLLDKDFGYRKTALADITDSVWLDTNRDGIRDEGGTGFANVTVNLLGGPAGSQVIATTTTDANGELTFADLPPGTYALVITDLGGVLAAYLPTTEGSARGAHEVELGTVDVTGDNFGWIAEAALAEYGGTTPGNDGNVNRETQEVVNQDVLTYDFGYTRGSIGDRVWLDVDGNGVQDPFEPGLNGVTLDLSGTGAGTDTTAGDGDYLFDRLNSGNYTVEVDTAIDLFGGLIPSFDFDDPAPPIGTPDEASVTLAVAEDNPNVDFGYTFDPDAFGYGCTPGYWKNHTNSWNPTPYAPGHKFNDVFGVFDPADPTLLQALQNENEGFPALNRHGVAALLNASHPEGGYLYSPELVILVVKYGYESGEWETMKNLLERQNESPLGCLVDDINTGKLPDGIFSDGFESGDASRWQP